MLSPPGGSGELAYTVQVRNAAFVSFVCNTERPKSRLRVRMNGSNILIFGDGAHKDGPLIREKVYCQLVFGTGTDSQTYYTRKLRLKSTGDVEWDDEFRLNIAHEDSVPMTVSCFSESSFMGATREIPTFGSVALRWFELRNVNYEITGYLLIETRWTSDMYPDAVAEFFITQNESSAEDSPLNSDLDGDLSTAGKRDAKDNISSDHETILITRTAASALPPPLPPRVLPAPHDWPQIGWRHIGAVRHVRTVSEWTSVRYPSPRYGARSCIWSR